MGVSGRGKGNRGFRGSVLATDRVYPGEYRETPHDDDDDDCSDSHDVLWVVVHAGVSQIEALEVSHGGGLYVVWETEGFAEPCDLGEVVSHESLLVLDGEVLHVCGCRRWRSEWRGRRVGCRCVSVVVTVCLPWAAGGGRRFLSTERAREERVLR